MKKLLAWLCALALLLATAASLSAVHAEEAEVLLEDESVVTVQVDGEDGDGPEENAGSFKLRKKSGQYTIVKYTGSATTVSVPKTIRGIKVVAIGDQAFYKTKVKKVTLPSTVKTIGKLAFAGLKLTKITMTKSVKSIASNAFKGARVTTFSAPSGSYAYKWAKNHGFIKSTSVKYRALLIGQTKFLAQNSSGYFYYNNATRNHGDVNIMSSLLGRVTGPSGGKFIVTKKTDLSYSGVKNAIKNAFSSATKNDVCLFFIATHGNSSGDGELEMPFLGNINSYDDLYDYIYGGYHALPLNVLAKWLKTYAKGPVIVLLQSCGAGSAIYSISEQNGTLVPATDFESALEAIETEEEHQGGLIANESGRESEEAIIPNFDPEAFDQQVISAFQTVDEPLELDDGAVFFEEELDPNSTGDFRVKNKFYVLAASRHHEESYGTEGSTLAKSYNLFTYALNFVVGKKNSSPADTNGNNVLTLNEIFQRMKKELNNFPITFEGRTVYQHTQVYPVNSSYKVFKLK